MVTCITILIEPYQINSCNSYSFFIATSCIYASMQGTTPQVLQAVAVKLQGEPAFAAFATTSMEVAHVALMCLPWPDDPYLEALWIEELSRPKQRFRLRLDSRPCGLHDCIMFEALQIYKHHTLGNTLVCSKRLILDKLNSHLMRHYMKVVTYRSTTVQTTVNGRVNKWAHFCWGFHAPNNQDVYVITNTSGGQITKVHPEFVLPVRYIQFTPAKFVDVEGNALPELNYYEMTFIHVDSYPEEFLCPNGKDGGFLLRHGILAYFERDMLNDRLRDILKSMT